MNKTKLSAGGELCGEGSASGVLTAQCHPCSQTGRVPDGGHWGRGVTVMHGVHCLAPPSSEPVLCSHQLTLGSGQLWSWASGAPPRAEGISLSHKVCSAFWCCSSLVKGFLAFPPKGTVSRQILGSGYQPTLACFLPQLVLLPSWNRASQSQVTLRQ